MNAAVFHQAVADGDATRVKFLINIGQQARVNQRNKQGYTPLQHSCKNGRYDVAEVLLSHGANTSATDKKGRTALHLASAGGYGDIVKLLIASCADISAKDNEGRLALDVARSAEIAALLTKAAEERKAKNPETNKKAIPEDWSQNVTSLPPGSRNSLVSNSSSDSGVFTEENSSVRNNDYSKFTRPSGYTCGRNGSMGVLRESDENLYDGVRERSRTMDDVESTMSMDVYEQTPQRGNTISGGKTFYERSQYEFGVSHLNCGRLQNNDQYDERQLDERLFEATLKNGNYYKQNDHEIHLASQTSMKMPHNANPQPKLRRSMSERLPARQRKQLNGRRNISEELAALNLSRAIARESKYCYDNEQRRSRNLPVIHEPPSPNEDLGYGGESFEMDDDDDDFGRSSARKYQTYDTRSLPRSTSRPMEFYPARGQAGSQEFHGVPSQNRCYNGFVTNGFDCDDREFYRRNQAGNSRGLRRNTIELCSISSGEDPYLAMGERRQAHLSYEEVETFSQREKPLNRTTPKNTSCARDAFLVKNKNITLRRNNSACSDTAVGSYHRRVLQQERDYMDFNGNQEYYYNEDELCDLPCYEETLHRLSNESRRPASRQVSQV